MTGKESYRKTEQNIKKAEVVAFFLLLFFLLQIFVFLVFGRVRNLKQNEKNMYYLNFIEYLPVLVIYFIYSWKREEKKINFRILLGERVKRVWHFIIEMFMAFLYIQAVFLYEWEVYRNTMKRVDISGIMLPNIAFVGIMAVMCLVNYKKLNLAFGPLQNLCMIFCAAVFTVYMDESINNTAFDQMSIVYFTANVMIVFICLTFIYFIIRSIRGTLILNFVFAIIWSLVNYYVYQFRQSVFCYYDIFNVSTALEVSNQYIFDTSCEMLIFVLICLSCIWLLINCQEKWKLKLRKKSAHVMHVFLFGIISAVVLIQTFNSQIWQDMLDIHDDTIDFWELKNTYNYYGNILGFLGVTKVSKIETPENYSEQRVNEIAEREKGTAKSNQICPDIVVIMNESFADLGYCGEFSTNQDYMPFVHSLYSREDTVTGKLLVSVFGGGTANTEYEFLTGNSIEFMPNRVAYSTEITRKHYSIASVLKELGYVTYATHPDVGTNWKRNVVYPDLGFDYTYFKEDYDLKKKDYVREIPSDQVCYDKVDEILEQKTNSPKFIFCVTEQNHGGYLYEQKDFDTNTYLEDPYTGYIDVSQYLSCIHLSDEAIEGFVKKLEKRTTPTIVVFFGDHYPAVNENFFYDIRGQIGDEDLSFEDSQKKYSVPYFIWNNYGLTYEQKENTVSANYLAAYLIDQIGLDTTSFYNFELKMMDEIPAMNQFGFLGDNGKWYQYFDDEVPEKYADLLDEYDMLEYNWLYGTQNEKMFGVE